MGAGLVIRLDVMIALSLWQAGLMSKSSICIPDFMTTKVDVPTTSIVAVLHAPSLDKKKYNINTIPLAVALISYVTRVDLLTSILQNLRAKTK